MKADVSEQDIVGFGEILMDQVRGTLRTALEGGDLSLISYAYLYAEDAMVFSDKTDNPDERIVGNVEAWQDFWGLYLSARTIVQDHAEVYHAAA